LSQHLTAQLAKHKTQINAQLKLALEQLELNDDTLLAAMQHGLLLGGKRIRPFLVYSVGDLLGAKQSELNIAACAIEAIHSYSLIHDDLPAMDDDALRRGQPTCHIAFDEASAILAGDALQTLAFELLSDCNDSFHIPWRLKMVKCLATASGYLGMCGGQALDIAATNKRVSLDDLEKIHAHKTGKLIESSVELALLATHIDDPLITEPLLNYAKAIGLAFQVQDDILDLTSDTQTLGKPQGSDKALNKSTYPALLGVAGAKEKAQDLCQKALNALTHLPQSLSNNKKPQIEILSDFANYIVERNK